MAFVRTILIVKEVQRSLTFYNQAFGLATRYADPSGMYAELETGLTRLSLTAEGLARMQLPAGFVANSPDGTPAGVAIAFLAEDVAASYARALEAGATSVAPPATMPWGQELAVVRDPDGVLIEIERPVG